MKLSGWLSLFLIINILARADEQVTKRQWSAYARQYLRQKGIALSTAAQYDQRFHLFDIVRLIQAKVPATLAGVYPRRFSSFAIIRLARQGITPRTAAAYGKRFNSLAIVQLVQAAIPPNRAAEYGEHFNARDIVRFVKAGYPPRQVQDYAPRFNSFEIIKLLRAHIASQRALSFPTLFRASQIIRFHNAGLGPRILRQRLQSYTPVLAQIPPQYLCQLLLARIPVSFYQQYRPCSFSELNQRYIQQALSTKQKDLLKQHFHIIEQHLGRYSLSLLQQLLTTPTLTPRSLALVLVSHADNRFRPLEQHLDLYLGLSQAYPVRIYEISRDHQIPTLIREIAQQGRIDMLWFDGHGTGGTMILDHGAAQDRRLDWNDIRAWQSLAPYVHGTIVLNVCSSAVGGPQAVNLATALFSIFTNVKRLYAPQQQGYVLGLQYHQQQPLIYYNSGASVCLLLQR